MASVLSRVSPPSTAHSTLTPAPMCALNDRSDSNQTETSSRSTSTRCSTTTALTTFARTACFLQRSCTLSPKLSAFSKGFRDRAPARQPPCRVRWRLGQQLPRKVAVWNPCLCDSVCSSSSASCWLCVVSASGFSVGVGVGTMPRRGDAAVVLRRPRHPTRNPLWIPLFFRCKSHRTRSGFHRIP